MFFRPWCSKRDASNMNASFPIDEPKSRDSLAYVAHPNGSPNPFLGPRLFLMNTCQQQLREDFTRKPRMGQPSMEYLSIGKPGGMDSMISIGL